MSLASSSLSAIKHSTDKAASSIRPGAFKRGHSSKPTLTSVASDFSVPARSIIAFNPSISVSRKAASPRLTIERFSSINGTTSPIVPSIAMA